MVRSATANIGSARVFLAADAERLALLSEDIAACRQSPELQATLTTTRAKMADLSALLHNELTHLEVLDVQCAQLAEAEQRRSRVAADRELMRRAEQGLRNAIDFAAPKPRARVSNARVKPAGRRAPAPRRLEAVGEKRKAGVSVEEVD